MAVVRIADIVAGCRTADSDNPIDLKVLDRHGDPVRAETLFHSGDAPDAAVTTVEGYQLDRNARTTRCCAWWTCSAYRRCSGSSSRRCGPGDRVVHPAHSPAASAANAVLVRGGSRASSSALSSARASSPTVEPASTTSTRSSSRSVLAAYDTARRRPTLRLAPDRSPPARCCTNSTFRTSARCGAACSAKVTGRSAAKKVPEFVWQGSPRSAASFPPGAVHR